MQVKISSEAAWVTFWAKRKDFNSKHGALNTKGPLRNLVKAVWMHVLFSLIKAAPGQLQAYHSLNGGYYSQSNDNLLDMRSIFLKSKSAIVVNIFKTAFSKLICNLIATDIYVWW